MYVCQHSFIFHFLSTFSYCILTGCWCNGFLTVDFVLIILTTDFVFDVLIVDSVFNVFLVDFVLILLIGSH